MKVVLILRVSTQKQEYDRQLQELSAFCNERGWEIDKVFANKISGTKKIDERPEILEMLEYIKTHDIEKVVCLEISRLGRSTLEALKIIELLNENQVCLHIKNYNLETIVNGKINPVTSLICTILLEISSLERSQIIERISSGRTQYINKCREQGIKMGRPSTYRKSDDEMRTQYSREIQLLRKKISLRNINKITSTSVGTLRKLYKYV